jgi:hypothetical protein
MGQTTRVGEEGMRDYKNKARRRIGTRRMRMSVRRAETQVSKRLPCQ